MKKIIALFLCFILALVFAGCGSKDKSDSKNKDAHSVDVEYYAKIGKMPEHSYGLGADSKEMKKAFDAEDKKNEEASEDGHIHSVYSLIEDDEHDILIYENAKYYYGQDGEVSMIVSLDESYGFKIGDISKQIIDAVGKTEEKKGNKEAIFFLPMPETYTYAEYTFGENNVIFVFQENLLCATAIYNPEKF